MALETAEGHDLIQGISRAQERTTRLKQQCDALRTSFQQAQVSVADITSLCDEADASVKRSQSQLNRAAREMHKLNERTERLLAECARTGLSETKSVNAARAGRSTTQATAASNSPRATAISG
mmetsp:Transcript_107096/g.301400  ORF Transcript_107096/g.301400 Transcript_107096/m.301400 type:complete len:123 (+) Transcript_107096:102-470(+)